MCIQIGGLLHQLLKMAFCFAGFSVYAIPVLGILCQVLLFVNNKPVMSLFFSNNILYL